MKKTHYLSQKLQASLRANSIIYKTKVEIEKQRCKTLSEETEELKNKIELLNTDLRQKAMQHKDKLIQVSSIAKAAFDRMKKEVKTQTDNLNKLKAELADARSTAAAQPLSTAVNDAHKENLNDLSSYDSSESASETF